MELKILKSEFTNERELSSIEEEAISFLIESINESPNIINEIIQAKSLDPNVKINSVIFKSYKYENFKELDGNRQLNKGNLKKLTISIEKYGYRSSQPITLNKFNQTLNGQHRLEVCKEKNLPIYFNYDECSVDSLKVTQEMNISQKNWTLLDFVKSYANTGNENYINFLNLVENEGISPSLIIWLIYHTRNGKIQDDIKSGLLRCSKRDITMVKRTVDAIKELRDKIPSNLSKEKDLKSAFLGDKIAVPLAIIMDQPNYNHQRMLKQVERCFHSIDKRSMSVAGESLVNIYNLRLKDSNSRLAPYTQIDSSAEN